MTRQETASRPIRWIVRESREANRTDSPAFYRTNFARAPARQSDGLTFGIPRPLSHGRISPALGRPTPIQPFPNPDMDGINRHPTTSQPSFGSNTRTTRFRLNHPTSVILQLRQRRAAWPWLVHQLPRPSRHFLHHPRREGYRQAAGDGGWSFDPAP